MKSSLVVSNEIAVGPGHGNDANAAVNHRSCAATPSSTTNAASGGIAGGGNPDDGAFGEVSREKLHLHTSIHSNGEDNSSGGPSDVENQGGDSSSGDATNKTTKNHANTVTTATTSANTTTESGGSSGTNNSSSDGDGGDGDGKPESSSLRRTFDSLSRSTGDDFLSFHHHNNRRHHHHYHRTKDDDEEEEQEENSTQYWITMKHHRRHHEQQPQLSNQLLSTSTTSATLSSDGLPNSDVGVAAAASLSWLQPQPPNEEGQAQGGPVVLGTLLAAAASAVSTHPSNHHPIVVLPFGAIAASDAYTSSSDTSTGRKTDRRALVDLVEPHKEPAFHKIKSTFKRLVVQKKESSSSSCSSPEEQYNAKEGGKTAVDMIDPASGPTVSHKFNAKSSHISSSRRSLVKNNANSSRSTLKPAAEDVFEGSSSATTKNRSAGAPAVFLKNDKDQKSFGGRHQHSFGGSSSSGSEEENSGEGNAGHSSGSGTEGGYAGSASSNDIMHVAKGSLSRGRSSVPASFAEDYSCSSPSGSSSEDNEVSHTHSSSKRSMKKATVGGGGPACSARPTAQDDMTNSSGSSVSSDLADYSSGATESKLAETMKALKEDENEGLLFGGGGVARKGGDHRHGHQEMDSLSVESISSGEHFRSSVPHHHHPQGGDDGNGGSALPHRRKGGRSSDKTSFNSYRKNNNAAMANILSNNNTSMCERKRRGAGSLPRSLQVHTSGNNLKKKNSNNSILNDGIVVAHPKHHQSQLDERKRVRLSIAADCSGSCSPNAYHHHYRRHFGHPELKSAVAKYDPKLCGSTTKPPIMGVGSDVMAHILTFLEPPEILSLLTMPLSKEWISTYTRQSELWRVLCLLEPFKVQAEEEPTNDDTSDDSSSSFTSSSASMFSGPGSELRRRFGKFRILYSSFVRCMRYLARIKDDALSGRQPSVIDYGASGAETSLSSSHRSISSNQNLQKFLARARGVVAQHNFQQHQPTASSRKPGGASSSHDAMESQSKKSSESASRSRAAPSEPIGVSDDGRSTESSPKKGKRRRDEEQSKEMVQSSDKKSRVRYGQSKLTQRLLLPAGGFVSNTELPWSCAIYSIVNWMVFFADVEGMQTMCLKVLPFLLQDEQQRMTAQSAGLTDVILRDMVLFPQSRQLHTAAFHTIVLLARPLGGREGMLFHSSMVNSSGIFSGNSSTSTALGAYPNSTVTAVAASSGKNGIAVLLDSMLRFQEDEILQAMSCWSLVNIALAPAQKDVLIKLGGVTSTMNAMMAHPYRAEVQFRALFALINLVIPCPAAISNTANGAAAGGVACMDAGEDPSAREVLDETVEQVVELVVLAMKNFCSSESILNRACLVLHNLSLTPDYHGALLWTPSCYEMLEWCLCNYHHDQVLQQSAAGTLHRLQLTLSSSEKLRLRFRASIASQQQLSLEQAHNEAIMLHEEQQRRLEQQQNQLQNQQLAQASTADNRNVS